MKLLSQVLNATLQPTRGEEMSNTANTPQHGLTLADGKTNTLPAMEVPLTAEQITALSSFARRLLPTVCWTEDYETLRGEDEGGEYLESKPSGKLIPVIISRGQVEGSREDALKLLASALRIGSEKSIRQAITRLAAHKFLAKNEAQLTLLLADYTKDLAEFPEFVVLSVCDFYRRENISKFMPTVAEMRKVCADFRFSLRREAARLSEPQEEKSTMEQPRNRREIPQEQWPKGDWDDFIDQAEKMAAMWRKNGETKRAEEWDMIARDRKQQRESKGKNDK